MLILGCYKEWGGDPFNFYISLEIEMSFFSGYRSIPKSVNDEASEANAWVEKQRGKYHGDLYKITSFGSSYFTTDHTKQAREDALSRAKGRELYEVSITPGSDRHTAASTLRGLERDLKRINEFASEKPLTKEYMSLKREIENTLIGYDEAKAANATKKGGRRRTRRRRRN